MKHGKMAIGGEWREIGHVYSKNKVSPSRLSILISKIYTHTMQILTSSATYSQTQILLTEFQLRQQSLNVHEQLDNIITYQLLYPEMLLTCLYYCH